MVGVGNDMCSSAVCDPTPNFDSDLDLDTDSDSNAAWAGIAVVIVFIVVGGGLWFGIRRRRRARGGHNSIDTGAALEPRLGFSRQLFLFWRRPAGSPEQPISVEAEMELGRNEEPKDGRNSVASNLKRTNTSGTVDVDAPPAAKLNNRKKEMDPEAGQYPMVPMRHPQLQSTEIVTPTQPLPTHNSRPSTSSSQRSSLSRLSIPPPGLGPPIHQPDPPPAPSTSQT